MQPDSYNLHDELKAKKQRINAMVQESVAPLRGVPRMRYRRFDKSQPALHRESTGNAGYDLFARLDEPILILPKDRLTIPLNIATEIPLGGVGLLFQRSSTFKKWGIKLTNSVGVIDASYSGDGDEWAGEFRNETDYPVIIQPGDKICQALFFDTMPLIMEEVDELGNTDRGGFGTTFDNAEEVGE